MARSYSFLLETIPFELTFNILFRHDGFNYLEAVFGRDKCCWEFLKLMNNSPRAELLCICRTVQLLEHPVHALFLLNYPPDSSIPENRRAWDVAIKCCITWTPDVRSMVLAMRAFISTRQYDREPFQWIDTVDLDFLRKKSEEEWKQIGRMQGVYYKFNEWWWNQQKEAFQLERFAARSEMWIVIKNTAKAEMKRLDGAVRRREAEKMLRTKESDARDKEKRSERDEIIRQTIHLAAGGGKKRTAAAAAEEESAERKKPIITIKLTGEDKKILADNCQKELKALKTVLKTVKQAFITIPSHLFEPKIDRIAKLIVSLEKQHPVIKWNLRLLFHRAASETGVTVWSMEFLVHRFHRVPFEENALEKINAMCIIISQ